MLCTCPQHFQKFFLEKSFSLFRKFSRKFSPQIFPGIYQEVPLGNLGVFTAFQCVNVCTRLSFPVNFEGNLPEILGKFSGNFGKNFPHFFFRKKVSHRKFYGKLTRFDKVYLRNYGNPKPTLV